MQRLNNLFQTDSENIHFVATRESVYLRQQRQTLEQGEARLKKNHNNILQETNTEKYEIKCVVFSWCQHLIFLFNSVWLPLGFLQFDSAVIVESNIFYMLLCFYYICSLFIYLTRCLNEESTLNP